MTFIAHQSRGLYSAAGVPTRHICIPFSSKTPSRVGLWVRKPVQSRIGRHSITKAHSDGGQDLAPSASRPQDAFKAAALRLQNLLNGVGCVDEGATMRHYGWFCALVHRLNT